MDFNSLNQTLNKLDVRTLIREYLNSIVNKEDQPYVLKLFFLTVEILEKRTNFKAELETFITFSTIIGLCNGEYLYSKEKCTKEEIEVIQKNEQYYIDLANLISIKYFIKRNYEDILKRKTQNKTERTKLHLYSPIITSLESLVNLMQTVNDTKSTNNPNISLIEDLFSKVFNKILGTTNMMKMEMASEIYATWRTLHEAECIIKLLVNNKDTILDVYRKHIIYNNALRGGINDQEELDKIFTQMKAEMAQHQLKSKDMKKYIEYGWLYQTKEFDETNPVFKLNFRDGVQRCANLSSYSEWYEAASEVTHSSPIFFYSNDDVFLQLSIIVIYKTTLRLTEIFISYYSSAHPKLKEKFTLIQLLKENCKDVLKDFEDKVQQTYGKEFEFLDDK